MSAYRILSRTRERAKRLGVQVKPSTNPLKKIDVFEGGVKVASVGQAGASDYPHYLQRDRELALQRQEAYKRRHARDRVVRGSAGWWADQLLWT